MGPIDAPAALLQGAVAAAGLAGLPVELTLKGTEPGRRHPPTIVLRYLPLIQAPEGSSGYVRPTVLLEFGAHSTREPHGPMPISGEAARHLTTLESPVARPLVMDPKRTFLEKAAAIHGSCRRAAGEAARAKTVDQGFLYPIEDLQPARTGAQRLHLQTVQRRLDMDLLERGERQDGCMNSPRQADPDGAGLLCTQAMHPQGREQAEHRLGNPSGHDLQPAVPSSSPVHPSPWLRRPLATSRATPVTRQLHLENQKRMSLDTRVTSAFWSQWGWSGTCVFAVVLVGVALIIERLTWWSGTRERECLAPRQPSP